MAKNPQSATQKSLRRRRHGCGPRQPREEPHPGAREGHARARNQHVPLL